MNIDGFVSRDMNKGGGFGGDFAFECDCEPDMIVQSKAKECINSMVINCMVE